MLKYKVQSRNRLPDIRASNHQIRLMTKNEQVQGNHNRSLTCTAVSIADGSFLCPVAPLSVGPEASWPPRKHPIAAR